MNNYMIKILSMFSEKKFERGTLLDAQIIHQDGCPFLQGGPCTCDPDITIREIGKKMQ